MNVFIAGAGGVIGRALIPILIARGHVVYGLVRGPDTQKAVNDLGAQPVTGDLLESDADRRICDRAKQCEAVVHVATALGNNPAQPSEAALKATGELRTTGTRHLVEVCRRWNARVYVQEGLELAYPDGGDRWLDESTPIDTAPARAALCGPVMEMERIVRSDLPAGCRRAILRAGRLVGPGTAQEHIMEALCRGSFSVQGNGSNFVSPVHVADYAFAISLAIESFEPSITLNINAEPIREGDYYDALAEAAGAPPPRRDAARACPPSQRCSSRAALAILGWRPENRVVPNSR